MSIKNFNIFVNEEIDDFYKDLENFEKETEQALLDPEPDEYSDFDPDRHAEKKGSLRPQYQQYGVGAFYRI